MTRDRRYRFTFAPDSLTAIDLKTKKIFTISGRLVRVLPAVACGFDYNQLEWDGLDKDGQPLANGVYLYKLDARASGSASSGQTSATAFRDKFIS